MKKKYIIPVTKAIYISPSRHLLIAGNSYHVNEYEDGGTINIGDDEDDDNSFIPKKSHKMDW